MLLLSCMTLGIGFIHIGSSPKSDRYRISMRDTSISNSFTRGSSKEKSGWEGRSLARGVLSSHLLRFQLFIFFFFHRPRFFIHCSSLAGTRVWRGECFIFFFPSWALGQEYELRERGVDWKIQRHTYLLSKLFVYQLIYSMPLIPFVWSESNENVNSQPFMRMRWRDRF